MDLGSVRTGLKTNLATITGLRTYDFVPDMVNAPAAIVGFPLELLFHKTMGPNATQENTIPVTVLVSKLSERTANDTLNDFASWSGTNSIRAAIESDKTLGGSCDDSYVQSHSEFGITSVGGIDYLSFTANVWIVG